MKPTKTVIQEKHTHTRDAVLHRRSGYADSLHLLVEAPPPPSHTILFPTPTLADYSKFTLSQYMLHLAASNM